MTTRPADILLPQQGMKGMLVMSEPISSGVIKRFHERHLPDASVRNLRNGTLADPTTPMRRDGYDVTIKGMSGIAAGLQSARPCGLFDFSPAEASRYLVLVVPSAGSGAIYKTADPYTLDWEELKDEDGNSVDPGGEDAAILQANDRLWIIPETGSPVVTVSPTGVVTRSGGATDDAPGGAVDGAYMLSRVFLLVSTSVYWSDLLPTSPNEVFDQTVNFLTFSPNSGSSPIGLAPWRNTSLILFFDGSIEEMIVDSSDPLNSARNVIEPNFGCCSRASIVTVGDDLYFGDQWGHIRSLKRNEQGSMSGVVARPLSYPIADEIPGNVNPDYLHRMRCLLNEDRLEVYYPKGTDTEATAMMAYDFSTQAWYGPAEYANPIGQIVRSGVKRGQRVYSTNGSTESPTAEVFLWGQGVYTDNGTAISYREVTKTYDLDIPEAVKRWDYIEVEFYGGDGVTPSVHAKTDDDGDWELLTLTSGDSSVAYTTDFPLTPGDFDLGDVGGSNNTPFPLTTTMPSTARARYSLLNSDGTARRSRSIQIRITEATNAVAFERRRWWIQAHIEPFETNPTD
jgi:hypothetical protein